MVNYQKWLMALFVLPLFAFNLFQEVQSETVVQVEVHDELASENQPCYAKLTIVHPESEKIDETSFQMEEKPLHVQFVSQGRQSSIYDINGKRSQIHQAISCYIFEVKETSKGKHILPSVTAKIGGKTYQSQPVNYFINATLLSNSFSLETFVDAPSPLYPGQEFKITYRIKSSHHMELFYENLPLLDLKFCHKKGKQHKRFYYEGSKKVDEFSQLYQAKEVGDFAIEKSFLEAREYAEDFFGRKRYKKEIERAESQALTLSIANFPSKGCPTSFNGAIGEFKMKVLLDSSAQVCLGDKLKFKILIEGKENLASVHLPNLSEQPSFKDKFRFNDLPLASTQHENQKIFLCELRPMKENLVEIPQVEFSYFNPHNGSYQVLVSEPIPITILPMKSPPFVSLSSAQNASASSEGESLKQVECVEITEPELMDIQGVYLVTKKELSHSRRHYYELEVVLVFLTLSLIQLIWKGFFSSKNKNKDSAFYLQQAFKSKDHLQNYQLLLEKSLLLRLREQKFIKEMQSADQLSRQGILGQVKDYINDLQMQLFAGQTHFNFEESFIKAKALYKKIGENL